MERNDSLLIAASYFWSNALNAIKQKKQALLAKVKEGRAIQSSLESTPWTAEEYEQKIAEDDAIQLEVLKVIQDVLNL